MKQLLAAALLGLGNSIAFLGVRLLPPHEQWALRMRLAMALIGDERRPVKVEPLPVAALALCQLGEGAQTASRDRH